MTTASATARIEVFRPGTFKSMEGIELTYTAADLKAMADGYDYETAPAPVVVGHPSTDAPAFAWAESFDFDATTNRLYATVSEINPAFAEEVKKGTYKKVSLQLFSPDQPANPTPGTWYPKHIGFLGGAAPAVSGLKNVAFSSSEGSATFASSFGERGFEETSSILRSLRDFLIEKFGMEDADKALPAYRLEWLSETEIEKQPGSRPSFSAPVVPPLKEPAPVTTPNPSFAAQEADLKAREERIKKREADAAHAENVSFAEGLVSDGKLLPDSKDKVVSILDALPAEASVSFAAGETAVPVAKALRDILAAQPKIVSFGAFDMPEINGSGGRPASFSADGKQVDANGMEVHARAESYQRQHPGTAYLDAVRAVS
ncbi:head maturation protease [Rhizobium phage RR1-B]|uniref:head maturation protease n=1 Tax=Rhizobium phage RR1-B TaxID=929834 RepID=UPI0003427564|nr:hypothetical protein [Rhizobium sp. P007]YP_008129842.1 head maturation protease [Rhizobium phage RR1-B]AGN38697.1 hypothetical protein RHYG_00028 [Rhizobium phage RR1-B]CAD7023099.1 peptidase [Rhizobium sp. P007]